MRATPRPVVINHDRLTAGRRRTIQLLAYLVSLVALWPLDFCSVHIFRVTFSLRYHRVMPSCRNKNIRNQGCARDVRA